MIQNIEDKKKEYGILIAKKSERLVTALYLVTDLITDSEPIKQFLRKNAVTLLSSMNSLAQPEVKDRVAEFKMSLKSVTEILSLLHVAVTSGIVSDMNGNILLDGFRSLQLVLEKKQPILTKDMLTVDSEEDLYNGQQLSQAVVSTSYDVITPLSIARRSDYENEKSFPHRENGVSIIKNQIERKNKEDLNKGQNLQEKESAKEKDNLTNINTENYNINSKISLPFSTSFQMRKIGRREQILGLFVKGVDIGIKDISSRIKGCSEKTIQRELNALLYDKKIERIGEKRWSRYVLK